MHLVCLENQKFLEYFVLTCLLLVSEETRGLATQKIRNKNVEQLVRKQ